jgi:hypothetical protein
MANRNNLLFYYNEDIKTIGGHNTVQSAVGVLVKFDAVVIKPHTTHLADLKKVLLAVKTVKPTFRVFGFTNLGSSADLATWQTSAAAWLTDLPGQVDGIFIENFGTDFAPSTRTNQNTAVTWCHTNGLSAMVNATIPVDALGQLTSQAETVLGRSSTIRDFILLDAFYYKNDDSATPTTELKESMTGRLEYVRGAKRKLPVPPATATTEHNLGLCVNIGGGNTSGITEATYDAAASLASQYGSEFTSVSPYDRGATSFKYFYRYRPNTFAD